MDTRAIAKRAGVRLGVDLSSDKRVEQVERLINQLLDYDSDAELEEESNDSDDASVEVGLVRGHVASHLWALVHTDRHHRRRRSDTFKCNVVPHHQPPTPFIEHSRTVTDGAA